MAMYLLKFSACLLALWLLYVLFLERQKMHRFKRFYLLGSFGMALTIPLLTITEYIEPVVQNFEITPLYLPIEASIIEPVIEETPVVDLATALWLIYGLGVVLFSTRFVINLGKLYNSISQNNKIRNKNFIYVLLNKYRIPHSFFSYIFLHKTAYQSNEIPQEVLLHEETHAKQLHSLDIIVIELLQIVMWFHPLVYLLKHHIKLNHEFLADEAVLNEGVDSSSYQTILLQFSSNTQDYQLSSAINYSSIKKRFTVMKTQTSKTRIWLSSLLLLPVCAILFYSFAEREYVQKETNDSIDAIDAIAEELKEANKLDLNYVDGASAALMNEYKAFLKSYNDTKVIYNEKYERARIIYDEIMSDSQRESVEKYPERRIPKPNLSKTKPRKPTEAQLEAFKDASKYAIWIDGEHVSNAELNTYNVNDFVHVTGSIVHKNARSDKFPQPNQYHLYTEKGFKFVYQDSQLRKYKKVTQTYSNAIQTYLKGSQTDNSELRILKAQADKIYKSFSKEEIKKNNILPPPPVPAEKKMTSQNRNSKGGPNFEDLQNVYNPSFLEYIIEMGSEGATFYLDDESISFEEAKRIAEDRNSVPMDMITQRGDNGNYIVKLRSSKTQKLYARSVELLILDKNTYLIDNLKATRSTFLSVFNQLHQDLTKAERQKVLNIHVNSKTAISDKDVWFIYNTLQDYGFYRIVTPNQEINVAKGNTPFAITNQIENQQNPPTKEEIASYNAWAKKMNAKFEKMPESEKVNGYPHMINDETYRYHNSIYDRMTPEQKKKAVSLPEAVLVTEWPMPVASGIQPITESNQEKATKKQIAEYNAWAKDINQKMAAAEKKNGNDKWNAYPIVKVKEVEKYKAIYNIMSEAQRKSVEPWPNFPPPPPPAPPAPKKTNGGPSALKNQNIKTIQPLEIVIQEDNTIQFNGRKIKNNALISEVSKLNSHLSVEDSRNYVIASIIVKKTKVLN